MAKRVEDTITPTRGKGQKAVEHSQQHVISAKSREKTASGSIALHSEPTLEQQAAADPTTPHVEIHAQQPANDVNPPIDYKAPEVVKSTQDHVTYTIKAEEREAGSTNHKTLHHDVGDYTSNDGWESKVEKMDTATAGLESKTEKLKPAGFSRKTRSKEPDIMITGGKSKVEKLDAARVDSHRKSTAWYAASLEMVDVECGLICD